MGLEDTPSSAIMLTPNQRDQEVDLLPGKPSESRNRGPGKSGNFVELGGEIAASMGPSCMFLEILNHIIYGSGLACSMKTEPPTIVFPENLCHQLSAHWSMSNRISISYRLPE